MGLKRRNKKKIQNQNHDQDQNQNQNPNENQNEKQIQPFDPTRVVKLNHKCKCFLVDEAPPFPITATPRQLQKRSHYYSESESEDSEEPKNSSEDDSSSTSTTTTSSSSSRKMNKKKLIHLDKNSIDLGLGSGGTAPANPREMLETSTTYAEFQKTDKMITPAVSLPHFKTYTVNDFHFLAVLGTGSFGKVYLTELQNTSYYYAVKCLKKEVLLKEDDVDCTFTERKVQILSTAHPYLCTLFCTFQTEHHLFYVMEMLIGGDLMFHVQVFGRFDEYQAKFFGAEIVSGLKFLHKKGIIYRDLKLDNVMVDADGHARICDFGLCKLEIFLDRTAESFCGTPDYVSPEMIKGQQYNQNTDWWSFGVLLYEMLVGQAPFSGCDEDALFWSICNEIPWYPFYLSDEAVNILSKLMDRNAKTRLGTPNGVNSTNGEITENDFFREIDWKKLERKQIEPPFKPSIKHPLDTRYFDRAYTRERIRLPPVVRKKIKPSDQEKFKEFPYTNPYIMET